MEEKHYPIIDEEDFVGLVSEPMAEAVVDYSHSVNGVSTVPDWIDDLDWDRFPSYGPYSVEEAIERIEKAEADMKDPSKWISSEEADKYLYEKYPWLR